MPELKTKAVSILYNNDGTCEFACLSTHISESQYKKLCEEMVENKRKKNQEIKDLQECVDNLKNEIKNLKDDIKVLKGEDENE